MESNRFKWLLFKGNCFSINVRMFEGEQFPNCHASLVITLPRFSINSVQSLQLQGFTHLSSFSRVRWKPLPESKLIWSSETELNFELTLKVTVSVPYLFLLDLLISKLNVFRLFVYIVEEWITLLFINWN